MHLCICFVENRATCSEPAYFGSLAHAQAPACCCAQIKLRYVFNAQPAIQTSRIVSTIFLHAVSKWAVGVCIAARSWDGTHVHIPVLSPRKPLCTQVQSSHNLSVAVWYRSIMHCQLLDLHSRDGCIRPPSQGQTSGPSGGDRKCTHNATRCFIYEASAARDSTTQMTRCTACLSALVHTAACTYA